MKGQFIVRGKTRCVVPSAARFAGILFALLAAPAPAARGVETHPATAPVDPRPSILLAIADDWSWPHAGVAGDPVVRTPTFDRVAAEGVLFPRAFCASPSCSPSRAALLTGQAPHRLGPGANLWGTLPSKFQTYPDALEAAGYVVGHMGKAWGPGDLGDRKRNPGGPKFKSFEQFLKTVPPGKPFCFWYGSSDPHRPYEEGYAVASEMRPQDVRLPKWLPDVPAVRSDLLDYYAEIQRFDRDVGGLLATLESAGRRENTLVAITSDNGMPFPRAKATCYDAGARVPLAIRWPARVKGGRTEEGFVSLTDLAPTFLRAAGIEPTAETTGQSLLPLLRGAADDRDEPPVRRDEVFFERERHANVRRGDLGYPVRAIRTADFLYVRNLEPDRWPAGDPEKWVAVGPFGDIDGGPTKDLLLARRDDPAIAPFFGLACAKRPAEELYDLAKDPEQIHNVAGAPERADVQARLRQKLEDWMRRTADPRAAEPQQGVFDKYPYLAR